MEREVIGNPAERSTTIGARSNWDFMSASTRGVRAEGDIGGYIWLPQSIGGKMRVNEILKKC
jgi:hypothetical protein